MLKKKTVPVSVKYALVLPQSVVDRIERCHQVAESNGYDLSVEDTLIRSVLVGVTRWEKKLGIGSNASPRHSGSSSSSSAE